jgi:hypothetical protein
MKRCRICGETKPLNEYYATPGGADGHRTECKACNLAQKRERYRSDPQKAIAAVKRWQQANAAHVNAYRREYRKGRRDHDRDRHYQRKFGITLEQYDTLLEQQGGTCAICRRPPRQVRLHVDHGHGSGAVRGLLCVSCNNALGQLQEDVDVFWNAVEYLQVSTQPAPPSDELDVLVRERAYALAR